MGEYAFVLWDVNRRSKAVLGVGVRWFGPHLRQLDAGWFFAGVLILGGFCGFFLLLRHR
jgi:hypothetical protein